MTKTRLSYKSARGAMLIQITIAMLAAISMTAWMVDYGMLWAARGQAQNAADAAALAGAIWLAYDDNDGEIDAKNAAIAAAAKNTIWTQPATILPTDVTIGPCPDSLDGTCVRVEVFRSQARNSEIPTMMSSVFGVGSQDVQAVAVARATSARSAGGCLAPFALPDRWWERRTDNKPLSPVPSVAQSIADWRFTNTFTPEYNKYCASNTCSGGLSRGDPLLTPDTYQGHTSNTPSGYVYSTQPGATNDKGTFWKGGGGGGVGPMTFHQIQFKAGGGLTDQPKYAGPLTAVDFHKLDLCRDTAGSGGNGFADGCTTSGQTGGQGPENLRYQANIETCNQGQAVNVDDTLEVQQLYHRDFLEEIRRGQRCLVQGYASGYCSGAVDPSFPGDPSATWDYVSNTIQGGCKAAGNCIGTDGKPSSKSPREIAVALFDPEYYDDNRVLNDKVMMKVTNIVGFFISEEVLIDERGLKGFFIPYSGQSSGVPGPGVKEVTLVR